MAKTIVNRFEAIKIKQQQCKPTQRRLLFTVGEFSVDVLHDRGPITKACQRIMRGLMGKSGLRCPLLNA